MRILRQPEPPPPPYWWLSFVDRGKPEGEDFLGAVVVRGDTPDDAAAAAAELDGVPMQGCARQCTCHADIEIAFMEINSSEEWRIEVMKDRWLTAEEVTTYPTEKMFAEDDGG